MVIWCLCLAYLGETYRRDEIFNPRPNVTKANEDQDAGSDSRVGRLGIVLEKKDEIPAAEAQAIAPQSHRHIRSICPRSG
jgi:hypothetical protein